MTNSNSAIITNGTVGASTDTDGTTDGSGTNTTPPNATAADNGNYGQLPGSRRRRCRSGSRQPGER